MTPRRAFAALALLALLVGAALGPHLVWGTGTMSIPNTISALTGGNQPASLLDDNWTAVKNYVNNREITLDVLSARPAASTAGRWFGATDVGGGTLYVDNGSTWTQVAASVTSSNFGLYSVRGLVAGNASLTVVNASATLVNLRNPSTNAIVVRSATSTLSNDSLTAGPAANGRDQSAQFTANSWVHLYYIWNGSTLATLSSACAPSDANGSCSQAFGPNLPTGYTHWAYIGAWRVSTANAYVLGDVRGASFFYRASQTSVNSGNSTSEVQLDIASLTAPNALRTRANLRVILVGGGTASDYAALRLYTGQNYYQINVAGTAGEPNDGQIEFANMGQQFRYLVVTGGTPPTFSVSIAGFTLPNNGE